MTPSANLLLDTAAAFDVEAVRAQFPALHQQVHGRPLVYLDNAATTQKPQAVIDRLTHYYERENSNVHRGVHFLSQQATDAYEAARRTMAEFIGAEDVRQVIFTRGTTEAINLVAHAFARPRLQPGDEIIVTTLEHHSNIVPWQLVCQERGASLRVVPIDENGDLDLAVYESLLGPRVRLVALGHVSNALGTVNPLAEMIALAHQHGIPVLVDGAQAAPHLPLNVAELDADFYCLSGHKMYGPTGIGVLYGRLSLLDEMPPYQGGGDMIETVSFEGTTFNELPHRFEAGTPDIAGAVGIAAAASFLQRLGRQTIAQYEQDLLAYGAEQLATVPGLRRVGTARHQAAVLSFVMEGIHPYDAGTVLDRLGIAVRTGHHCTQPLMACLGLPGTIRASLALYNTRDEIDALVEGLHRVRQMFS